MSEQFWMMILSGLGTANLAFVGILIKIVTSWRRELMGEMDKYCAQNAIEHKDIWQRVNHHMHNGEGHVTIID